jgi:beta-glucosidase
VRLVTALHLNAYRLAVDWSRVEPTAGNWDAPALAELRAQLEALRAAHVEPLLTLYRGSDPVWFSEAHGWLRGDAVQLFCRFVVRVAEEVGDLVTLYVTVDGPGRLAARATASRQCGGGDTAASPLRSGHGRRVLRALLHAHGAARRTLREATPRYGHHPAGSPQAGLALDMHTYAPRRAASAADRLAVAMADYVGNQLPLRILTDGRLHAPAGRGEYVPELDDSLDFLGLTPGARATVAFSARQFVATNETVCHWHDAGSCVPSEPVHQQGAMPAGARALAHMLKRAATLAKPLIITADGLASVPDSERVAFLRARLATLAAARTGGADVRGYLYAPLLDLAPAPPSDGRATSNADGSPIWPTSGALLAQLAARGMPPEGQ